MRVLAAGVLAIAAGLLVVFTCAALRVGAWPSGADASGFGAAIAVSGAMLIAALQWPVLASLRRRGVELEPARAGLVAALGVNAPVYAALAVVGRDRSLFAGGEAALLALGFAAMALVFGAGYACINRRSPPGPDTGSEPEDRG